MAKFTVAIHCLIERELEVELKVTKAEIVEHDGLEGEDKADWEDYVEDYVMEKIEELLEEADIDLTEVKEFNDVGVTDIEVGGVE